jgi:cytidyltransferase-like protein
VKTFKIFFENTNTLTLALFPGAFKPPHKGHLQTVMEALKTNQKVIVLISGEEREGINPEKSMMVWNQFKQSMNLNNLDIHIISGSPVTAVYQIVDILNNGSYSPTKRSPAPLPESKNIADNLLKQSAIFAIKLYASEEDFNRYNAFFNPKTSNIYVGKNVKNIDKGEVKRLASATDVRRSIVTDNFDRFKVSMPDIGDDKLKAIFGALQS